MSVEGAIATIGGVGLGNVIGANGAGITVESGASATIVGNYIGTSISGVIDLGNVGAGIQANDEAVIGGTGAGESNVIAFNAAGVTVTAPRRGPRFAAIGSTLMPDSALI